MINLTQLEKENLIKTIAAKNPKPIQDLCPELIIHKPIKERDRAYEAREYYHVKTGKTVVGDYWVWSYANSLENPKDATGLKPQVFRTARPEMLARYAVCHELYNAVSDEEPVKILELAIICIGGRKTSKQKTWDYCYNNSARRVFIIEGDKAIYLEHGEKYYPQNQNKNGTNETFVKCWLHDYNATEGHYFEDKHTRRFFDIPSDMSWYCLRTFYTKMKTYEQLNKQTKKNPAVNKLNEIGNAKLPMIERVGCFEGTNAHFSIEDDHLIIRIISRSNSSVRETYRIVINNKGKAGVFGIDSWHKGRTPINIGNAIYKLNGIYGLEKLQACVRTSYLYPIVNASKDTQKPAKIIHFIVNALRHPILEQLALAGAENIAWYLNDNSQIHQDVATIFDSEEKKIPLLKNLGVNGKQLQLLDKYFAPEERGVYAYYYSNNVSRILSVARYLAGGADKFLSMDEKTSKKYLEYADIALDTRLISWSWNWRSRTHVMYSSNNLTGKDMMKIINMCKKDKETIQLFVDIGRLYNSLQVNYRPEIDWSKINSARQIVSIHDNLCDCVNRQLSEREAERNKGLSESFKKLHKKNAEKYEETGEDFMTKYPSTPAEITTEGAALGHCVGSYVDSIAQGHTEIIFLRRKESPNIPFYTIEVRDNRVVQIHGRSNKWLGCNPECIPFVKKWLEDRGINYEKRVLLETATHYSSSGQLLDGTPYGL